MILIGLPHALGLLFIMVKSKVIKHHLNKPGSFLETDTTVIKGGVHANCNLNCFVTDPYSINERICFRTSDVHCDGANDNHCRTIPVDL